MIIDTHCHIDMMPNPEAYIRQREKAGDIVIGMTNLPSHFEMGFPHVGGFRHIRLALGLHPLLAAENIFTGRCGNKRGTSQGVKGTVGSY